MKGPIKRSPGHNRREGKRETIEFWRIILEMHSGGRGLTKQGEVAKGQIMKKNNNRDGWKKIAGIVEEQSPKEGGGLLRGRPSQ